jgi:nicotinamide mononucleotide transporter
VIGQVLMMQRRVENWAFWLLVNTIAAPLYFSRGLHLTALLYAFFWVNAIASWVFWRRRAAGPTQDSGTVSPNVHIESHPT